MSELKGLELRQQACEALGWRWTQLLYSSRYYLVPPQTAELYKPEFVFSREALPLGAELASSGLPAIESDYSVALPMLMEFCENRELTLSWELRTSNPGEYCCIIGQPDDESLDVSAYGENPCEAIARAIVMAGHRFTNCLNDKGA